MLLLLKNCLPSGLRRVRQLARRPRLGPRLCTNASPTRTLSTSASGGTGDQDAIETAKQLAAQRAVEDYFFPGCRLGIGSGSTIVYAVHRLQQIFASGETSFQCVPTSFQAQELIVSHGLNLSDLSRTPQLDVAIDGADEVDASLNCIKGGGGCLVQEKVVASCAKTLVLVADNRKQSTVRCCGLVCVHAGAPLCLCIRALSHVLVGWWW